MAGGGLAGRMAGRTVRPWTPDPEPGFICRPGLGQHVLLHVVSILSLVSPGQSLLPFLLLFFVYFSTVLRKHDTTSARGHANTGSRPDLAVGPRSVHRAATMRSRGLGPREGTLA